MKIPLCPPDLWTIYDQCTDKVKPLVLRQMITDDDGRYLHWDKMRHLTPPSGLTVEQWWAGTRYARLGVRNTVPLSSSNGNSFEFCTTNALQGQLHSADVNAAGNMTGNLSLASGAQKERYLIKSLVLEAITSSQLEGASTTIEVAKELLRSNREPVDKDERMISNNYAAMQFTRTIRDEQLTPSMVFELHKILTEGTLDDPEAAGRFRTQRDDIKVVDNRDGVVLHVPPPADQLANRLALLCDFANNKTRGEQFIHPVIRSIIVHFMLAYDHPFVDGNGRTARALFYLCMAKHGYWLMEYVSISKIIKAAPMQYARAFLYTETDHFDLTYFILHQMEVIESAIEKLQNYLQAQQIEMNSYDKLVGASFKYRNELNRRQLTLLVHALKNPGHTYNINEHKMLNGISYDTARSDLVKLSDNYKLLMKTKVGKTWKFLSPSNLKTVLQELQE